MNFLGTLLLMLFLLFPITRLQARPAVTGKEVTGTFKKDRGYSFEIQALGNNQLKVHFLGVAAYQVNGQEAAHVGEATGIARIEADMATFSPPGFETTCKLVLFFVKPGEMMVSQQASPAECGFGLRVDPEGKYLKTSSAKPDFSD